MKLVKLFSITAVALLLLAPATAMAKTSFHFSLNMFDRLVPVLAPRAVVVPPPPPVFYVAPRYQQHTIVKEYHYFHQVPLEEQPAYPRFHSQPRPR